MEWLVARATRRESLGQSRISPARPERSAAKPSFRSGHPPRHIAHGRDGLATIRRATPTHALRTDLRPRSLGFPPRRLSENTQVARAPAARHHHDGDGVARLA